MIYLRLQSLLEQDNIYLCMRCITTDVFSLCTGNEAITAGWGFDLFRVYIPNINKFSKTDYYSQYIVNCRIRSDDGIKGLK